MQRKIFMAVTGGLISRASADNSGESEVNHLLEDHEVTCLAYDPADPNIVFAGTRAIGVLRSADSGLTWQPSGMENHYLKSLSVSPIEPGTIYAGTKPAYLFVSRDGGSSWSEFDSFRHIRGRRLWFSPAETPFKAYIQAIALSPTDPQAIVVGIESGAVVMADRHGAAMNRDPYETVTA